MTFVLSSHSVLDFCLESSGTFRRGWGVLVSQE